MDLPTFERLLTPEGQDLLAEVHARAGVESDLALGTRLRRSHPVELVAAAVTQNHLRGLARRKLGDAAASMYFTHDALEQATRSSVADHRARRLAASGVTAVTDLGCGIGGDLVAFARAGLRVRGVELDPVRAAIARANLAALGLDGTVDVADATEVDVPAGEAVFLDPARRDGRGRVFDPERMTPPWDVVTDRLRGLAVVKTMPGLGHDVVPEGVEAEWVSDGGSLVEACLWGVPLASAGRRATVLPSGAELVARGETPVVGAVGGFLHEPDDAVIRAGLVAELAADLGGRLVDPHIAYVTTDEPVTTPLAASFRVVQELPFREKPLKTALQDLDVGTLTVKKRGVDVVPEQLVKRLKLRGRVTTTVVMTRVDGEGTALLVERL
jgi:hypothetical protein